MGFRLSRWESGILHVDSAHTEGFSLSFLRACQPPFRLEMWVSRPPTSLDVPLASGVHHSLGAPCPDPLPALRCLLPQPQVPSALNCTALLWHRGPVIGEYCLSVCVSKL